MSVMEFSKLSTPRKYGLLENFEYPKRSTSRNSWLFEIVDYSKLLTSQKCRLLENDKISLISRNYKLSENIDHYNAEEKLKKIHLKWGLDVKLGSASLRVGLTFFFRFSKMQFFKIQHFPILLKEHFWYPLVRFLKFENFFLE